MPQDRGAQSQAVIRLMTRLVAAQATLAALTGLLYSRRQLRPSPAPTPGTEGARSPGWTASLRSVGQGI
jgi:hypothetical protein